MLDGKYEKRLLDIKELCEYLGIGMTKARELVRGRNGFGVQIGMLWSSIFVTLRPNFCYRIYATL